VVHRAAANGDGGLDRRLGLNPIDFFQLRFRRAEGDVNRIELDERVERSPGER
jgi:hypothetical protein